MEVSGLPRLSILVPYRNGEEHRAALWTFVSGRLARELPGVEVIASSDDGADPFSRSLAVNEAARRATGNVYYITDSDTWLEGAAILEAAARVRTSPQTWERPWRQKVKLGEQATRAILALGEGWDGTLQPGHTRRVEARNSFWAASPIVLGAETFWSVDGFDPRFRGHGHEDEAFGLSLRLRFGMPRKGTATAVHLWHPRLGRSGNDRWPGQQSSQLNLPLVAEYRRAAHDLDAMADVIATR